VKAKLGIDRIIRRQVTGARLDCPGITVVTLILLSSFLFSGRALHFVVQIQSGRLFLIDDSGSDTGQRCPAIHNRGLLPSQ
jgi:hypothetical protein